MIERLDYIAINPKAIQTLFALKTCMPSVDPRLRALIEVRVSQINGCAHCVDVHTREARAAGETQRRLDCLPVWREAPFFSDAERVALDWAEAVTRLSETYAPRALFDALGTHFSDVEVVDITLIITLMNAWNRLALSFGHQPEAEV